MAINLYQLHFLSPIFFSEPNKKVFHLSNKTQMWRTKNSYIPHFSIPSPFSIPPLFHPPMK